jgi:hypothetical protein
VSKTFWVWCLSSRLRSLLTMAWLFENTHRNRRLLHLPWSLIYYLSLEEFKCHTRWLSWRLQIRKRVEGRLWVSGNFLKWRSPLIQISSPQADSPKDDLKPHEQWSSEFENPPSMLCHAATFIIHLNSSAFEFIFPASRDLKVLPIFHAFTVWFLLRLVNC